MLLVKRKTMLAETETTKEGVRTKCPLLTIGTQILQRTKKKVIPTENIKAEVEVAAAVAEADVEIVVDIEAEEVRTLESLELIFVDKVVIRHYRWTEMFKRAGK